MALLDVPFVFEVRGLEKGKRKWRDYAFRSTVAVAIAEADADQAPVVLRQHRASADVVDAPPPMDYRWLGDRLYVQIDDDSSVGAPLRLDGLRRLIANAAGSYDNPLFTGLEKHGLGIPFAENDPRRVSMTVAWSDEEEQSTAIARRARDLLLVGGEILRHEPGLEPVYVLKAHIASRYDFCRIETKRIADFAEDPGKIDVRTHFRVDQLSDALVGCSEKDDEFKDWNGDDPLSFASVMENRVEVLDASILTFRPIQAPKLLRFAREIVEGEADEVAKAPVAFMLAYAKLRDALADGVEAVTVAERLSEFSEHFAMLKGAGNWRVQDIAQELEAFANAPVADHAQASSPPRP